MRMCKDEVDKASRHLDESVNLAKYAVEAVETEFRSTGYLADRWRRLSARLEDLADEFAELKKEMVRQNAFRG